MNIKQAKEYIKNSVHLYLKKDEWGEYKVPVVRQRPIFLLGAPGIGKTAIMEQIAQEMGIALVTYSMTHHTRQSALGLPYITEKVYDGRAVQVSEYTMSEIIATIYDTMEASGIREGILFLDEINCVSETLAPSMLQFLQYKVFGRHRVPEGWVIVTAGNPPEYNRSVREFDVVTLDRLKLIKVEPDYPVWKEYAAGKGIHNAVLSYLDLKKDQFYRVEMTAEGRNYVTARGWEDLAEILTLYEEEKLAVDESLVGQYLRNERVVKEFTAYYDLYHKYQKDYPIGEILAGKPSGQTVARARAAAFDERLSLLGILFDRVRADMGYVMEQADLAADLRTALKALGVKAETLDSDQMTEILEKQAEGRRSLLSNLKAANALSEADKKRHLGVIQFLEGSRWELCREQISQGAEAYEILKNRYAVRLEEMKSQAEHVQQRLHGLFGFVEEAFSQGNELLVLMTELTVNEGCARFIAAFGSPDYRKHQEEMMLGERQDQILERIERLGL